MLHRKINGQSITYMDSAATSLKPQQVVDSVTSYYQNYSANVHRGVNLLAEAADKKFTHAREVVAEFINSNFEEVIFTSGTTDAMNMVCDLLSLDKDDEVICSIADHHSAMLPWRKNAKVVYAGINADGSLNLEDYHRLITDKTRLVIITQVSNVLGVVNPIHKIIEMAHQK
ncbi:MAG: aminotransferase class V-fold PLP-dependent enzyme, partial [Calditrichota bacterium]